MKKDQADYETRYIVEGIAKNTVKEILGWVAFSCSMLAGALIGLLVYIFMDMSDKIDKNSDNHKELLSITNRLKFTIEQREDKE